MHQNQQDVSGPTEPYGVPPLQWEKNIWEGGHIAAMGPAATRLSDRGRSYKSAVPPKISTIQAQISAQVALLAREAELELARFDVEAGGLLGSFGPILLRSEAASSSQIENLTASARQIFTAEVGGKKSRNAVEIAANSRAMIEAISLAGRLDVGAIRQMHRELMQGQESHTPGDFRKEMVWIGTKADSPIGANYVAPNFTRVPDLIDDLCRYIERSDIPPLEQVAIAHAQFETIHPFTDGNGRTGRALAQAMLRNAQITRSVVVPVSAGLLTDVQGYHQALTDYRQGDPNPIVHSFAAAALRAIPNGRKLVADINKIHADWKVSAKPRPGSIKEKILEYALTQPVFTVDSITAELNIPPSNIYRYLNDLGESGILARYAEYRGPVVWRAQPVLDAIDAFAARAGRRVGS